MIKALVVAALAAGSIIATTADAGAVVCARGVYRAGCAGPNGAVGVARPAYRPPAAGVVVGPRGGAAVYRRY